MRPKDRTALKDCTGFGWGGGVTIIHSAPPPPPPHTQIRVLTATNDVTDHRRLHPFADHPSPPRAPT